MAVAILNEITTQKSKKLTNEAGPLRGMHAGLCSRFGLKSIYSMIRNL